MSSRRAWSKVLWLLVLVNAPVAALVPAPDALREEAVRLITEDGAYPDYRRAFKRFCLAALEGDSRAAFHLASMYLEGNGRPADEARAAGWFVQAESLGDPEAGGFLETRLASVEPAEDPRCPLVTPDPERKQVITWVHLLAPYYKLSPGLVLSVIRVESNFNARAKSPKNAMGLMQLILPTAERFQVEDVWNPLQNIKGGMAYLAWLKTHFRDARGRRPGTLHRMVAAYNAGEDAVRRHDGIPPYKETRKYVRRVIQIYARYLKALKGRQGVRGSAKGDTRGTRVRTRSSLESQVNRRGLVGGGTALSSLK